MSFEKKGYIDEHYHFFHLKDCEGQELDFHFHEFDKLVILLSGHVTYYVEPEDFALRPWDILLVPHHTIHKASIDQSLPYERIIIYFDSNYLRGLLPSDDVMYCFRRAAKQGDYLLHPVHDQEARIASILTEYERCMHDQGFGREAYLDTLMLQLLIWIGRLHTSHMAPSVPSIDEKIQEVITYINEHLTSELCIEALADYVHLSRSYFMSLFKRETGSTVHAYISQKRLLFAARRIREGIPVNLAMIECGFSDYTTFYRSFKHTFGISPKEIKE